MELDLYYVSVVAPFEMSLFSGGTRLCKSGGAQGCFWIASRCKVLLA